MATVIRAEISQKNKYYVDKHRYYELKHFCLQYGEWKKAYASCTDSVMFTSKHDGMPSGNTPSDLTAKYATLCVQYDEKIKLVERIAIETDEFLAGYILKAVTEGLAFTYLKSKLEIPCSRGMYYDRYRKFFWLLNQARN
jgi:hypothetical protein